MFLRCLLLGFACIALTSCSDAPADPPFTAADPSQPLPSLAQVFAGKFRFGFGGTNDYAVRTELIKPGSQIRRIVEQQSNVIGINCFYAAIVRPQGAGWKWDNCEQLLAFADEHPDWPRRGHTLFWPSQRTSAYNLEWLLLDASGHPVSREEAIRRLREHIHTIVSRYRGRIQFWDVVNEAVDPQQPDGLRKGLWHDVIGPDMVEIAFQAAREADPQAKLFYNDAIEWRPARREAIYQLAKRLKAKGLIDGIGMQQHVGMTEPTASELHDTINRFAKLGLELHVTELDVEVNPGGRSSVLTPAMAQAQARRYRELFDIYRQHAGQITAVMTWNVADNTSWLRNYPTPHPTWPLLFDAEGKPKPAFWAIAR